MTRKLPEDYRTGGEWRSIGRVALVLWTVLFSAILVVAVASFLGAAGGGTDASWPVVTDESTVRDPGSAERDARVSARTAADANGAKGIVERYFPGVDFSARLDGSSGLDFRLLTGSMDVRFAGLGGHDGRQTGAITHDAIDEGVARSSSAGLCAVGLTGSDAPVSLDVDPANDSVRADLASGPVEPSGTDGGESAAATVQSCRSGTNQSE